MRRLPALVAALQLPSAQQVLLGTALSTAFPCLVAANGTKKPLNSIPNANRDCTFDQDIAKLGRL